MLLDAGIVGRQVDDSNEADDGREISSMFLPRGDTEDLAASQKVAEGVHNGPVDRSVSAVPGALFGGWEGKEGFDAGAMEHWKSPPYRAHPNECPTLSLGAAVVALGGPINISAHHPVSCPVR